MLTVTDELGIDLCDTEPTLLTREVAEWADVVSTMGCGDKALRFRRRLHRPGPPRTAGRPVDEVRATRDDFTRRIDQLLTERDA